MDVAATDPDTQQAQWNAERRVQVLESLDRARLIRGDVGDFPAWQIYPYVSVWAVESHRAPGLVGWWVICGDCPTDYVTARGDGSPRTAVRDIAAQWQAAVPYLARGEQHPDFALGRSEDARTLAPLLSARAEALLRLADEDDLWPDTPPAAPPPAP